MINMIKEKKLLSIIFFILMMSVYCLLVMAFLVKINFNNWLVEFIVYFILGIIWVFPSMYILRPFKKRCIIAFREWFVTFDCTMGK